MRMRTVVSAALLAISATAAQAQNDQVRQGPPPDWAAGSDPLPVPDELNGPIFVRYVDSVAHLTEHGQSLYTAYRIRILHPNALQLGNLSLTWNPQGGAPTVHMLRIHRGNAVTDVLPGATFNVLRREDQLEQAHIDGMLTAVFQVPDLRVGDEIEVAMTVPSNDPTLGSMVFGTLFVTPEPPPGRLRLGLSWEAGQEPTIQMTPLMAAAAQRGNRRLDVRFDNPATLAIPNLAPPRFAWQRTIEYSDFPDWMTVSRRFAGLYREASAMADSSALREEVRRIETAHATPLARAQAALRLVQQDVRYIYVGLNAGNLTPASAEETWQRRYGDCKGKTTLLLALLRELGIDAIPVLVNNANGDDGLNERLPNPGAFDHVVVRATIDGSTYWLDGTLPTIAAPSLQPAIPYRWFLPLTEQGSDIVPIPWQPTTLPFEVTLHDIDARAGFDQPAIITRTTIVRGPASLLMHAQLSAITASQLLNAAQQSMTGDLWQSIDEARYRYDEREQAGILTIRGTGPLDWDDRESASHSMTLPGGGFNPPERRVRPTQQDQTAPYYNAPDFSCHVTTVRIPTDTEEARWSHNRDFNRLLFGRRYVRAFEVRDGAIRMIRISRIEQQELSAADAQQDNAQISSFDNSMALIYYQPSRTRRRQAAPVGVPTTDEINWAASRTPCLTLLSSE